MQDALPALVLNLEALPRHPMSDSSANLSGYSPQDAAANSAASDEQLMLAFSKGSTEAFTALFSRYKQPIYGFFRRRVTDPSHAEELAQETFFALLRAHRRKETFRATFLGQRKTLPDPSKQDTTESGLWVRRAVEKLDPLDREILLLREFEQLSYAEVADLLDLPLNTVRSRLFRARTALRELLDPSAAAAPNAAAPQNAPQAVASRLTQKGDRA
jgi:RNA polymerase sigma-70 factor (ECF subfamily)